MKAYILQLLSQTEWHLREQQVSKMSLKDRIAHEKVLVKLKIIGDLLSKFTIQ